MSLYELENLFREHHVLFLRLHYHTQTARSGPGKRQRGLLRQTCSLSEGVLHILYLLLVALKVDFPSKLCVPSFQGYFCLPLARRCGSSITAFL